MPVMVVLNLRLYILQWMNRCCRSSTADSGTFPVDWNGMPRNPAVIGILCQSLKVTLGTIEPRYQVGIRFSSADFLYESCLNASSIAKSNCSHNRASEHLDV